jgi:anaerobic magnesium-protoporphyrin IX monomethyl ester cyclase
MNILLIDPPFRAHEIGGKKENFKYVINRIPSLGLAYLGAVALKNGHNVKIIDCTLGLEEKEILKMAQEFNPRIIGITTTTPTFKNAGYIASILRDVLPNTILICGGAHPTACPENSINTNLFDFLVLGEGEETFIELISYIEDKQFASPEHIRGIAFKQNDKVVITAKRPRIENLDSLPFPARHLLFPLHLYRPTPASYRRLPLAVIMTSRGCPTYCVFCDRAVFGEKFRQRSVANVMAEVEEVVFKYGAKEVRFFDDTFTLNPLFVESLCKEMSRIQPRIPWTCLTRVTSVNYGMLKLMHEAGCWQVLFGLESGEEFILEKLGKDNTVKKNREAVLWAREARLSVRADFLVGSPWETKKSLKKTAEFAKSLPIDFAHFNKFVPYAGTAIYKDLISKGYNFTFGDGSYINNHTSFAYIPDGLRESDYANLLNSAYREFYLRLGYMVRRLLSIRTFTELIGYFRGLCSIVNL